MDVVTATTPQRAVTWRGYAAVTVSRLSPICNGSHAGLGHSDCQSPSHPVGVTVTTVADSAYPGPILNGDDGDEVYPPPHQKMKKQMYFQ